jgi:hypothetical protein
MLCIVEIAMTIFGIVTLTKGRISFSKRKVVTGGPAYLIGAMLTATFPVTLAIGMVYGFMRAAGGQDPTDIPLGAFLIDVAVVAIIGVGAAIVAAMFGGPPDAAPANPAAADLSDQPLGPPKDPDNPYAP